MSEILTPVYEVPVSDHRVSHLRDLSPEVLNDAVYLDDSFKEIAEILELGVVESHYYKYHPQGVIGAVFLKASHFVYSSYSLKKEGLYLNAESQTCMGHSLERFHDLLNERFRPPLIVTAQIPLPNLDALAGRPGDHTFVTSMRYQVTNNGPTSSPAV